VIRPLIALVGRPNVGKSTLFNRIVGRRAAIVEDAPGVTRDRNYADVEYDGRAFSLVDTGGFEPASKDPLAMLVRRQAQLAVDEAAAVILVTDGREGLTRLDEELAQLLRRCGKPLFVAVNKVDSAKQEAEAVAAEFHRLGLGEVHEVSAEHARGVVGLMEALLARLMVPRELEGPDRVSEPAGGPIRLAIVGRPNVGKSTFVNALTGEERLVVAAEPGTTRDAIDTSLEHKGMKFVVTDTAGIRRKSSVAQRVEAYSIVRAMRSMDQAEVVACLVDAGEAGVEQDSRLLAMVVDKGRALVIVVNKWDLAEREHVGRTSYRKALLERFPFAAFAPVVFCSGKTGQGVRAVLDVAARLIEAHRARFPTPALNELLESIQLDHPAPLSRGRPVKLYYVAQVGSSPPTFVVQCNRPEAIGDAYRRFVENRFREAFGLEVPLRIFYRARKRRSRPPPER